MPQAVLNDRALVSVAGPEAGHFLQNILTLDIDTVGQGEARPGALLTPQGKILFDFLVARRGEGFVLDCAADAAGELARRLTLYRLRAKVEIAELDPAATVIRWGPDAAAQEGALRDMRFPPDVAVFRSHDASRHDADNAEAWLRLRIANAVAESGADFARGDAFPHDVLLDQNGGVGFKKGCYIGQEVVSRMQHRGTARRRILLASADEALPAPATDIQADGRSIGTLGSVAGMHALALVRIDKVKAASEAGTPILAGGVALRLSIPPWAHFTFPAGAAEEA